MGSLKIDTLDTSFTIQVDEDDEYLNKLMGYYNKLIEQIKKNGSMLSPLQISIMAGLNLCDELYKEKSKRALSMANSSTTSTEADEELDRLTSSMIAKIEKALQ